jgi:hypothetical protein
MEQCKHHFKKKPDGSWTCERCGASKTISDLHTRAEDLEIKPDKYTRRQRKANSIADGVGEILRALAEIISW